MAHSADAPPVNWTKLLGPPALLAVFLASALLVFGSRGAEFLGWMLVYMVPPAGKESVIPALIARGYPPWLTLVYLCGVDILAALFVLWNFPLLLRVPRLGPALERARSRWEKRLQREPWLRSLAFTGTMVYIAIPLQGSGGVGGTVLGRTLGMKQYRVLVAVIAGSALGSLLVTNLSWLLLMALDLGGVWAAMILLGSGMVAYSVVQNVRKRARRARAGA